METLLVIIFLVLFLGESGARWLLEQLNIRHMLRHGRDIPPVFAGAVDPATVTRMADYTADCSRLDFRENRTRDLIELAVLFGALPVLTVRLGHLAFPLIAQALIFFTVLALIGFLAGLPFDVYRTFVLEKKYGFSTVTWRLWLIDQIKSLVLSAVLLAILVSALMAFILWLPGCWWFWGWVFFAVFQIVLLWLYPVLIAPLFNTFAPIADDVLRKEITALLQRAGLTAGGIYQVDEGKRSRHTNAYFTGFGKTKRIVIYDTLLASHTPEEIVAVLAHEIGHWKGRHLLKQLALLIPAALAVFYGLGRVVAWPPLYAAFGISGTPVYAGLFVASLYLAAAGFFLKPLVAAVTRRFEREADALAVELTGTARPLIGALRRLAKDNLRNLHPHPWYVLFFYTHPPLVERLEYLQAMDYKK
jgi:STE24 endopeptidase